MAAVFLRLSDPVLTALMPYLVCSPEARILEPCSNVVMLCVVDQAGVDRHKQQLHALHCAFRAAEVRL